MDMHLLAKSLLPTHPTLTWPDGSPVRALGVSRSGRLIWPQRGGAPDGDEGGGDGDGGAGGEGGKPDKTFTQDQLNAATAEARSRAERAAHRKLLGELGLPEDTKPEDVKKTLKAARDAELAALSDADRAKREAEDAKAEVEREKAAAAAAKADLDREKHELRVGALLERAGVAQGKSYDEDEALKERTLARALKLLDVEIGADSDAVRKAIEDLKKEMPALFTAVAGDGKVPDGKPGSGPGTTRQTGKSGVAAGREEAIKRGWVKEPAKTA